MFLTIRTPIEEVNFSYHLGCQLKASLLHYMNNLNIITQKKKPAAKLVRKHMHMQHGVKRKH